MLGGVQCYRRVTSVSLAVPGCALGCSVAEHPGEVLDGVGVVVGVVVWGTGGILWPYPVRGQIGFWLRG